MRTLPAATANTCPRTSLISFCIVQLRTLCAAHSLTTVCHSTTSGPDPGELPGFWGSMVFRHAPIPRKGSGNQQQQQQPGEARVEIDVSLDTFALVSNYHCFKVSASIFHFLLSAILLIYLLLIKFSAKWVNSYFTFSHSHLFDCCYFVVVLTCDQTWLYSFFLSCCKLHHFDQSFTAVNEW